MPWYHVVILTRRVASDKGGGAADALQEAASKKLLNGQTSSQNAVKNDHASDWLRHHEKEVKQIRQHSRLGQRPPASTGWCFRGTRVRASANEWPYTYCFRLGCRIAALHPGVQIQRQSRTLEKRIATYCSGK